MLRQDEVMEVKILARRGMSIKEIVRQTGYARGTVRKYLRSPEKVRSWGPMPPRPKIIDAYVPYLKERLSYEEAGKSIPATVYLREIQARGYPGEITQLRKWLREERDRAVKIEPLIRFETAPGHQVQIDWTVVRKGKNPLSAFAAVLGHSRWSYVWFSDNERLPALMEAHERFFETLGGVPAVCLYDNAKTIVEKRHAYGEGRHKYQSEFEKFAEHHGFLPKLCRPYRAQTKGKVERYNQYLKRSFVWPLESRLRAAGLILDADTANVEVGGWLRDVANVRVHAETKRIPQEALSEDMAALSAYQGPFRQEEMATSPAKPLQLWDGRSSRLSAPEGGFVIPDGLVVPQHDLSIYEGARS